MIGCGLVAQLATVSAVHSKLSFNIFSISYLRLDLRQGVIAGPTGSCCGSFQLLRAGLELTARLVAFGDCSIDNLLPAGTLGEHALVVSLDAVVVDLDRPKYGQCNKTKCDPGPLGFGETKPPHHGVLGAPPC